MHGSAPAGPWAATEINFQRATLRIARKLSCFGKLIACEPLGCDMQKPDRIDFAKLLGFELVTRELLENFDLQEETIGAKLGAKVGAEAEPDAPKE